MRCLVALAALLIAPAALAQQTLADLPAGSEILVRAPGLSREGVRGVLSAGPLRPGDTLRFVAGRRARTVAVPVDSLWRVDVHVRTAATRSSTARRSLVGAATGAVAGLALGAVLLNARPDCGSCRFGPTAEEERRWKSEDRNDVLLAVAGAAAAGAALWAVQHVRSGQWNWERVATPARTLPGGSGDAGGPDARQLGRWAVTPTGRIAWAF